MDYTLPKVAHKSYIQFRTGMTLGELREEMATLAHIPDEFTFGEPTLEGRSFVFNSYGLIEPEIGQ